MKYPGKERPNFYGILLLLVISVLLFGLFLPVLAQKSEVGNQSDTLKQLEQVGTQTGLKGSTTDLPTIIGKIIKIALSWLGIIALLLVIAGGFMWMTSGGNEDKIKKAKSLMINAFIGLAIILLSYVIAHFVIEKIQSVSGG